MAYAHLDFEALQPRTLRKLFGHVDGMLADIYAFFKLEPEKQGHECGSGNFTIPLVLCCLIDGLAVDVWPTCTKVDAQDKRFKRLIRERLPYHDNWVDKGFAARFLYLELRNPLVHQAGQDVATSARRGMKEVGIGKWVGVAEQQRNIDGIEALDEWPENWPLLSYQEVGEWSWYDLSDIALYWAVKKMAKDLLGDCDVMDEAAKFHRTRYDQTGSRPQR